jgi:hypothetical protein
MLSDSMDTPESSDARRGIPSLDRLLSDPAVSSLIPLYGRGPVRVQARREVDDLRDRLAAGSEPPEDIESAVAALPGRIAARIQASLGDSLTRFLNATGILLHTLTQ